MPRPRLRHAFVSVLVAIAMLAQVTWALAGTTGNITGTLTDTSTGKAVADAKIGAVSPSQSASTTTDAGGHFTFLALAPDTYVVSAEKEGYAPVSLAGVTVFADQSLTLNLSTHPELKTIARVTSRAAGNLVKPGTTSDVYSVNAATQQVVGSSSGGFNLNTAYSGIYSQPGVTSYIGNAGWGQVFYIRGSAYSQVGYEFDGVPVNRAFDNYQANSLSNLGQQELQVYTGGSPSGASSATLGGFINQVIKTGTYPGFGSLMGGIGAPGFYHALTAEAGGANPNRTFSYYVGLMGYNQHFPAGAWNNMSNIASNGLNPYGLQSGSEIATPIDALFGNINGAPPDAGAWAGQWENGPFGPCQQSGPNAGLPIGFTAANPGPFNGTCFGYFPFNTALSDMFERDTVVNFHFGIPHKFDSGRDDIQLLYDNSMQHQMNGDSINDAGGLATLTALLAPYATSPACFGPGTGCGQFDASGNPYTGPAPGLCGYENLEGLGCATTNSPIPYVDTMIFAPGTSFGQPVSTATIIPYYFPNSNQNRTLNTPFAPVSGIEPSQKDAFHNDVGIVKVQYTKNLGSNAYARLFGYSFYSDWLIGGAPAAGTCYIDGLLCGDGGPGFFGTADYELTTHTRGAEFQFADQLDPHNLLRFTANYTTASVARWNNSGTFLSGYLGSRSGVTDWTNGDPNNPICYAWKTGTNVTAGFPANCDYSNRKGGRVYGTFANPTPLDLPTMCGPGGALAATPGCASFNAGTSNWLVTTPSGQGTFNTVRPVFMSFALEDELKPTDRLDLNLGVRFEQYRYDLNNSNKPEFNFWFSQYARVLCYDPGTNLPQFTPLGLGQPVPPNLKVTGSPLAPCGTAPSGQEGLHPVGAGVTCDNVTTFDCGPLQYTAVAPNRFTRNEFSPRIGGTYTLSPDTVLRFSAGKYTQPTETAFEQYLDQSGKRAANFDFSRFWGLGFHTPAHDNPVQYSNNYDFSIEHHLHGTDLTVKVSPFYRDTRNQIETVVLGPGFVSGTNSGHQHSYGVELAIAKGDPTRDGWSGQLAYTYTKALVQFGTLPSGTNSIDYLNDYIKAFNALTQAGGGSACYDVSTVATTGTATGVTCPASFTGTPSIIVNPYFSMAQQPLLDRNGWYQPWPNEFPNAPFDQGGSSAIWPHQFSAWIQYKHGRWSVAPNLVVQSGAYYGSPTDVYGIDPRTCGQNEAAATTPSGGPVPGLSAASAGNCDFLTAGPTPVTDSGDLAIPNPYTGKFDMPGQYQQPWQVNMGALIKYDISPKITVNLALSNIVNWCYGGTNTAWQKAFKPGYQVCGYSSNPTGTNGNFNYVGPLSGQPGFGGGFFYGDSPGSVSNGSPTYPSAFNYPFAPFNGALPFQAYLQVQIKF
ncbi:MAG TPA: TonB-dependent receptor [Candidatus Baltobacteraceae bacterium]|nr:TonB-dependent receptor [Candidatus Baltobacteraceae bacterium]